MSDLLGLYCWVMGDETQQYFPIKILHTEDVGTLKDYIKEKKKPQLDQLPANALKLWKVSIPIGEVDTRLPAFQPVEDRSNGVLRLSPGDDLIDVFPDGPPRKQIHIIVQVSSPQPISEEETKQNMEAYLGGKCKTMMDKVISGECALPTFGSTDIPSINDFPSLLLHNIGVFSEEVEQRISKVFTKKTTLFVNTSGSGKTRLVLDGLCKHWGFYFTCGDKTLGSADLQAALRMIGEDSGFKSDISSLTEDTSNRLIFKRYICAALLARAILFGHFRTNAKSKSISETNQKRIWVLLQAWPRPPLLTADMFHELTNIILRGPLTFIVRELGEVWGGLDLGNAAPFLVLDEAQDAARMYTRAFYAKDGVIHRSALSALTKTLDSTLEALLPYQIVTGTGLNLDQVRGEVRSGSIKFGEIEVIHDTGSFLTKENQSAYIMRYLWPGKKEGELADDAKRLLRRAWRWLRGRYRITSSFVELALTRRSEIDLNELLNHFFEHLSGFWPIDADFDKVKKRAISCPYLPIITHSVVETLTKGEDRVRYGLLLHCLMNYVLSSQITYQNEEARTLVEIGVASFCESAGKVEIAEVKEPIAIYALLDFFKGGGQDIGQYLNDLYFTARKSPGGVFEEIIAWNIFVAFSSGKELNSVFHFCGTTIPKWANESAQLLAITKKDDNTTKVTTECSFPFIRKAPNSTATLEWASNPDGIPILFPDDYLGPDMVAVFETLETKRVIILSLQSKSTPSGEFNLKAALATTNPDQYYMVKRTSAADNKQWKPALGLGAQFRERMKGLGCKITKQNTLRVLATFPTKFKNIQKSIKKNDIDNKKYPIVALLQPDFFEETAFNSVFEYIRKHVLGLGNDIVTDNAISKKRKAATHTVAGMRAKRQKKAEDIPTPSSSRLPPASPSPTWTLRLRPRHEKKRKPPAPAPAQ